MRALILLLLCLLAMAPLRAAHAMRFAYYPAAEAGGAGLLTAAGPVVGGDADRLQGALRAVPAGARLAGLSLNSPGGDLDEGLRLATMVRAARLTTMVTGDAMCASACFNVFAAGPVRYASTQARIGVHSVRHGNVEDVAAEAATLRSARQLAEFNVPETILGKMVAAAPDQVWWLDRVTLAGMNVGTHPPVLALRPAAAESVSPAAAPAPAMTATAAAPAGSAAGFRVEHAASGFSVQRPTGGFRLAQPGAGG